MDSLPPSNPSSRGDEWAQQWCCWHRGGEGDPQRASEIPSVLSPAIIVLHIDVPLLYPTREGGSLLYSGNGMTPSKSFTRSVSDIIKCFVQRVSKVSGEQGASSTHLPFPHWLDLTGGWSLRCRKGQSTAKLQQYWSYPLFWHPFGVQMSPTFCTPTPISTPPWGLTQSHLITHTHRASLRLFLFLQNEK